MFKVLIISLLAWFPVQQSQFAAQPVEMHIASEISNETLDALFDHAALEWDTTTDFLWFEYQDANLQVTQLGDHLYELESITHGNLTITMEEDL